jgi:hypothetical protein
VLVENVYIVEIQAVLAEASASMELPPRAGLTNWPRRYVEYRLPRSGDLASRHAYCRLVGVR